MSRFGWLALIGALFGLAYWLKGSPRPAAPPASAPTVLDEHLRTVDRAQAAVDRMNDAVWRQREGLAKANPELFARDLEGSSARQPLTRAEAERALSIARAHGIAAAWEGASLRVAGLLVRVAPQSIQPPPRTSAPR